MTPPRSSAKIHWLPCFHWMILILLFAPHPVFAQFGSDVRFTSSPNPVGSGARAQGMGGAFIAVADDATAASWNPGGLIQLERPEFSVVGEAFSRREALHFADFPKVSGD